MFNNKTSQFFHIFLSIGAVFITISLIFYPDEAFDAAVSGLNVWWGVVFPALLPFFIGAEILIGLGIVHFMGIMLEPFMRPVFNVPGSGSFVMAVGLASGFPIGAILTSKLRKDELLSKTEAERLLCFTNTADPLFMFGAVAVGMFHSPHLGILIAIAHYLSSFTIGLLMRFYKKNSPDITKEKISHDHIIIRAGKALFEAKANDGRPLGKLLGDAIKNSINTLLIIGGFIILFSVIIRILTVVGIINLITASLTPVIVILGLDPQLITAGISGFFEVTLGCEIAGSLSGDIPITQKLMAVSAIIAWSGLSVHAQVASIISDTDINIFPFILARILHGILAALYTIPVVSYLLPRITPAQFVTVISEPLVTLNTWQWSFSIFISVIALLFIILLALLIIFGLTNSKFISMLIKKKR